MLSRRVTSIAGDKLLLRPLTVDDAKLYPDFLADVTTDDLRLRFFAPMRQVNPDLIHKLIHYDPKRAMAFVALDDATGKLLGVVRLHDDADGTSGEFAILLRSNLKGHGIGWLLMKHMIVNAKAKGLRAVRGQVMSENTTMLQMCGELGFHIVADPLERGIQDVTLPLDEIPPEATYFP